MKYNQYWNEIKDDSANSKQSDELLTFSYSDIPETESETPDNAKEEILVSPDTYGYLDDTKDDELLHDSMLEEQDIFDEEEDFNEETSDIDDDSEMYESDSLFDLIDEIEENDEQKKEEQVEKAVNDSRFVDFSFSDDGESDFNKSVIHIFAEEKEEIQESVSSDFTPLEIGEEKQDYTVLVEEPAAEETDEHVEENPVDNELTTDETPIDLTPIDVFAEPVSTPEVPEVEPESEDDSVCAADEVQTSDAEPETVFEEINADETEVSFEFADMAEPVEEPAEEIVPCTEEQPEEPVTEEDTESEDVVESEEQVCECDAVPEEHAEEEPAETVAEIAPEAPECVCETAVDEPEEPECVCETAVEESEECAVPEAEQETEQNQEPEEESVVEPQQQEPAATESMPYFQCPVFDDQPQTNIDDLIKQAEEMEQEEEEPQESCESNLLPLLKDIVAFMPLDCPFVSYLANLSEEDSAELVKVIEQARKAWGSDRKDKMFTVSEGEFSICVLSDVADPMRDVQRLETVGAQMFSYDKERWGFIKLYFGSDDKLMRADYENVTKDSFNSWQWRIVQQAGFNLWKSRQK